jgi:hypothetical protein
MDQQLLLVSGQAIDCVEERPLALIGQVPMVPTYHDRNAGNSGDGHVPGVAG